MKMQQDYPTRRVLSLWLPDWPVQRLRLEQPSLRGKPLALSVADGRTERITACSSESRLLGVQVGMRTPDAQALAGPGELLVVPHRAGDDRRALIRLAKGCDRFSPIVALEDAEEPTALLLDITSLASLWDDSVEQGEKRLADHVSEFISEQRIECRIAVADTSSLSIAAARFAASVAIAEKKPLILSPSNTSGFVARLPLWSLKIDEPTLHRLRILGVETLGQLMQLPRAALPSRFGPELANELDQLLGFSPDPIASISVESPLIQSWEFETAVRSNEPLKNVTHQLLKTLSTEMLQRRRGALRVLIIYQPDAEKVAPYCVVLRLFRPTASAGELQELAELQSAVLRLEHPIRAVQVLIGSSAPIENRQRLLFDDDPRDDPHELALLINRLVNRVGVDLVSRVEKQRSADPSKTYVLQPATDVAAQQFTLTAIQAERTRRLPLAFHSRGGEPIEVETNGDGEPCRVGPASRDNVLRCWGPERVETGWWRSRGIRRDAYWVELHDGQRLWLCRDLSGRVWRLVGEFF